ncbi:MAG: hypothetical protein KDD66_04860 [Bdellovibrionales bacterium]|nr:hypothetical protein [Bdellovibrionales bacterium]
MGFVVSLIRFLVFYFLFVGVSSAVGQEVVGGEFMRVAKNASGEPVSLETSIVHYVPASGRSGYPKVDLISAVHIGEGSYYAALNKRFAKYDAVLYELVAPKGTVPIKGEGEPRSIISSFQLGLTNLLGLEFQLDKVDYSAANFVHADTSPEEFTQQMEERGESFLTMFMRLMAASYAHQQNVPQAALEAQLLMLVLSPDPVARSRGLKRLMAEQFKSTDVLIQALNGKEGSTLISGRNDAALKVLKEELGTGKKTFAIFYGGGHMPDLDQKLKSQFGLKPVSVEWLQAWDLTK